MPDIGAIGLVIRGSVGKIAPDLPLNRRHKIARQILADLSAAGFSLKSQAIDGSLKRYRHT